MAHKTYHNIWEMTCPICGKNFIPAAEHIYDNGETAPVCSWTCHLEARRRKEAVKPKQRRFRRKPIPPGRDEDIRKRVSEGESIVSLAEKYEISTERVKQIIRESTWEK